MNFFTNRIVNVLFLWSPNIPDKMSGQGGRHMVADEMFPDGPGGGLDYVDPEDGVSHLPPPLSIYPFLFGS